MIIPFTSTKADLQTAGGKGANLARLTHGGFPVPPGFILAMDAYRQFVEVNDLGETISESLRDLSADDPIGLEKASTQIRSGFSKGKVPPEIISALRIAYAELNRPPVAVRSSATLEDLPNLSFAGQQDTYLNILGEDELIKAVVNCWSSLWTGRAIGYRIRNEINHAEAALGVVVQEMVPSEISGVLFTANPVTGLLSESVIDATFGLGEALVSGQVEPDHYVVDHLHGSIIQKKLGEKKLSTRGKESGGVETVAEVAGGRRTLSDDQVHQLVALGQQVQEEFGQPQDIEWAIAKGDLHLLQSRPITSLFPVPEVSFDPLVVWFSFGAVQGLVGPITPLGRYAIQYVAVGAGRIFGLDLEPGEVDVLASAGERLWVKTSDLIRNPIGYRVLGSVFGFIEPSVGKILEPLLKDPNLGAGTGKIKFSTLLRLARFALPLMARMARTFLRPETAREEFNANIDAYLAKTNIPPAADRFERLEKTLSSLHDNIANTFYFLLPRFIGVFGTSMASLNLLNRISGDNRSMVLEVTRGLPNNVTTQMDLALWEIANQIRTEAKSARLFRDYDAPTLSRRYLDGALPSATQAAVAGFMEAYGMRGVGEVDLGRPRWREAPTSLMRTLQSYLEIDAESAPNVQFRRGEKAALTAIEELAATAREQPVGWLKEKLVRAAARRVRLLMGLRETPKFLIIRLMGITRRALLEIGDEFVEAGTIEHPGDIFFLQLFELQILANKGSRDWKALISRRRAAYQREQRRRQIPRVLVSDGRAFYEGLGVDTDSEGVITGSPVSPGKVEGIVRVVFDPNETQLSPGEILVCPGTDPSWTPLFMAASGLITEVGGMMTHGSVVAREYGIPAVVGVHQATEKLEDGQRIQLDGTAGRIVVLN